MTAAPHAQAAEDAALRVMVFLHSFDPGGVERVALRLAGSWAEAGAEVRIVMGRRGGALEPERPAGVAIDYAPPSRIAPRAESLWMVPHLIAAIRRHRPDVLFCAGNTYASVAVIVRLLMGRKCPPIVAKISNSLERPDFGPCMRRLYALWLQVQARFIDRFVGMAEAMRPEMAAALDIAPDRLSIINDPALSLADIHALAAWPEPASGGEGRLFVGVGRLARQKDFGAAIRAFAGIVQPGDRLVLLGDGPERPALQRLAADLDVADQVEMPGHQEAVGPWLAAADVFVLSSLYEGVPAAVIEALAAGAPIVATDCCVSMAELLDGGRLGRLIPLGDVDGLAEAMEAAAAEGRREAALQRVMAERFTIERSGAAYLAVLDAAASRAGLAELVLDLAAE